MATQPLVFNSSHFIATPSGNWSFFNIGVGAPSQNFSVLVSTVDDSVILPFYDGGVQSQDLFNTNDSASWQQSGPGTGIDIVTVGSNNMSFMIAADNSVPPLFGVVLDDSDLLSLEIPSQSFGYSAGAAYRGTSANLVLGGYDETEIAAMGPSFNLSSGYIMNVTLTNITATNTIDNSTNLLPSSIFMLLDSSVEDFYMPTVICDRFVSAFGLIPNKSDHSSESFSINSSTHQQLRSLNPIITLTVADPNDPSTNVDVVLSYKSLDYSSRDEPDTGATILYPLRDIGSASNGTLGRRFFQEIYAIVDYSRGNFSISRPAFITAANHVPSIITISDGSNNGPTDFADSTEGVVLIGLSTIVGIGMVPGLIALIYVLIRKRRSKPQKERLKMLDRLWIQIHTIKPEGQERDEMEDEEESRDVEIQEQDRLLGN